MQKSLLSLLEDLSEIVGEEIDVDWEEIPAKIGELEEVIIEILNKGDE